jgi:hypothetical protein
MTENTRPQPEPPQDVAGMVEQLRQPKQTRTYGYGLSKPRPTTVLESEAADALTALAAAEAHIRTKVEAWQPIETAPRDGTEILGWDGVFMTVIETLPANYFGDGRDANWHPLARPTHWRPLPEPPAITRGDHRNG